jgi:uncharacterized protein YxjI
VVPSRSAAVAAFGRHEKLSVRQRKRWAEILFSWESKNAYDVFDEDGAPVLRVEEQGQGVGNVLKRLLLRSARPFTAEITDLATQRPALQVRRPFRFIFHRLEVMDESGQLLGTIERKWSWVRRIYKVLDADGREVAGLFGPILRPWTFEIHAPGDKVELGVIQKRWSGLGRELFTDADNFGLMFTEVRDPGLRALLFAATVLIDIVHFERSN